MVLKPLKEKLLTSCLQCLRNIRVTVQHFLNRWSGCTELLKNMVCVSSYCPQAHKHNTSKTAGICTVGYSMTQQVTPSLMQQQQITETTLAFTPWEENIDLTASTRAYAKAIRMIASASADSCSESHLPLYSKSLNHVNHERETSFTTAMKRSQETLFQFHPTHNSILRWAFYMQHPSPANIHKYKLHQGSSLCNTHQHPKTICHYVNLGFLGQVLFFSLSNHCFKVILQ